MFHISLLGYGQHLIDVAEVVLRKLAGVGSQEDRLGIAGLNSPAVITLGYMWVGMARIQHETGQNLRAAARNPLHPKKSLLWW